MKGRIRYNGNANVLFLLIMTNWTKFVGSTNTTIIKLIYFLFQITNTNHTKYHLLKKLKTKIYVHFKEVFNLKFLKNL